MTPNANFPQNVPLVKIRLVKEKRLKYSSQIHYPESIVKLVWPIFRGADRELFVVVGLDTRHFPTVINIVSFGNAESTQVHPRETFKTLILSSSFGFICVHNHPAGSIDPSKADIDITKTLQNVGNLLQIGLVDHLIVTNDPRNYLSFKQRGLLG